MDSDIMKKFENYLILNRLAPRTQDSYLGAIAHLAGHYNRPANELSNEQIQQYIVYLIRHRKLKLSSCNVAFCAINCFYARFLNRDKTQFNIPPRPRQKRLPEIFNQTEVQNLFKVAKDLRHQAVLMMAYGSGLRVSELVHLKRDHIDSGPWRSSATVRPLRLTTPGIQLVPKSALSQMPNPGQGKMAR